MASKNERERKKTKTIDHIKPNKIPTKKQDEGDKLLKTRKTTTIDLHTRIKRKSKRFKLKTVYCKYCNSLENIIINYLTENKE